ncbi:MAG: NAD(P)-dependent oxidoreductase [Phototrophicaceae bacterium]
MNILVTGALGWTAKAIIEVLLQTGHAVYGFDLPAITPQYIDPKKLQMIHYATVTDYEAVYQALSHMDVVIHLAVAVNGGYDTPKIPFDTNVRGTANILSAAIAHGVKRVILMSSAPFHVQHPTPIHAINDRLQGSEGDFLYDLTKCLQEDIAEYYAKTGLIDVITLRAGHIVDGQLGVDPKGRDLSTIDYGREAWVCRYDLARAVNLALTYPLSGYTSFHIIGSQSAKNQFDMERTEHEFGFLPLRQFEAYRTN